MTNDELIGHASALLRLHLGLGQRLFGDVVAALISERGQLYTGVCIDTASWGLCAERSAIAAMATAGEYRIRRIVAVWRDKRDGRLSALPPCGICREFMREIDDANLEAEVVVGRDQQTTLAALLPEHEWPSSLD
jgi:cytidine deaminase